MASLLLVRANDATDELEGGYQPHDQRGTIFVEAANYSAASVTGINVILMLHYSGRESACEKLSDRMYTQRKEVAS